MLSEIKHHFMAYRNGIIADTLRKAGYPHKIIFGLQLPQLKQIADRIMQDLSRESSDSLSSQSRISTIAQALWQDKDVRESRLLATYLMDSTALTPEDCLKLADESLTQEEADMLAFRVLRHRPDAPELLPSLPERVRKSLGRFLNV